MSAAARKKSDATVSKFQLNVINGILADANAVLGERRPLADFVSFEADDLPSTGDVSMIAAQYVETLEIIRCENIENHGSQRWYWRDQDNTPTVAPRARK
ncbi:hypothetical protein [Blastomonas fulva]|uniref:hypothetical protein n=1 Tax=Blastomonas fulva TaxID=1550728 RepID=UPI003F6E6EC6